MNTIKNRIESYFDALQFNEEKHIYTVGDKILPSVSGLIKQHHEPFPKDAWKKTAARTGKSKEEIKAEWKATSDEACERGTRVHLFGELYPFDRTIKPKCKQEEACKKFWDDMPSHIVPLIMELRMYHKTANYAGTTDIVLYNRRTDSFLLGDYKTNRDLFKNYKGKKMLGNFAHLLDNPFNKYQLQLSYYQILFEQLGLKVDGRKLIWLNKTGNYEMYDTVDYTSELKQHLKIAA